MDKLRTKIVISLQKLGAGYAPKGAALKTRLNAIHEKIKTYPKSEQEAMVALFDVLCERQPNRAAGTAWSDVLEEWRGVITGKDAAGASGGMSIDAITGMIADGQAEAEKAQAEADQGPDASHAALIADSGLSSEDGEIEDAEPEIDPHAAIIESAENA